MVPTDTDGLKTLPYKIADGSIAEKVEFTSARIPKEARLHISLEQFENVICDVSLLACAEMLGLSELLLNETVEYTKQREQFGVRIGSFQAIQHILVDCYAEVEQIRSLLLKTLLEPRENTSVYHAKVAGMKSFISDRADFVARNAVQYHGAMGITEDVIIGSALKRVMLLGRLFGDSAHCLNDYLRVA